MNLQESIRSILKEETNQGKYISALEDLTEEFKNEDCVCDIKIEYKPEEFRDSYLINVMLGIREINSKFKGSNHQIRRYLQQLKRKITDGILDFLPIPFFVNFSETPNCSDYRNLQESENKKSSLLSRIEEYGLYEIMASSGLHINQVEQKVGQLSREVLERFITDVLKEHGESLATETQTYVIDLDGWPLDPVPIANDERVERIRTTDNELFFTIILYEENEHRDLEEVSYKTKPSKNLKYDNIYEIAGQLGYYLVRGQI